VVRRPMHPAFADDIPYAPAVIELDDGVRMVDVPARDDLSRSGWVAANTCRASGQANESNRTHEQAGENSRCRARPSFSMRRTTTSRS
jgi:hypothetical protein